MAKFKTKARAVDLLGKGQIADLPTAITELWKNGYDAYADNVGLEIYEPGYENLTEPILIISDDGTGMSQKDIFDKWLVLGTDSKSRNENETKSPETLWKEPRIKAGEKGIGRLSISFIGSPMLMLTKKTGLSLQALYFDWRILENYNLFLDDIQIPVNEITSSNNFQKTYLLLKDNFLKNLELDKDEEGKPIWEKQQENLRDSIKQDTDNADFPDFLLDSHINPLINNKSHGTYFILFNPEDQLLSIISKEKDTNNSEARFLRSSLLAFTNTFSENKLPLSYEIPIYSEIGKRDFLTSGGRFFKLEDFIHSDIIINGKLNGKGDFQGKIRIYDKWEDYNEKINPRKLYKNTDYGNCDIKLGYVLGREKDSLLEGAKWIEICQKLDNYGGIYLYRDGFRILPYGRADKDFLGLEERRSKSAAYYFFSYRRMFGYVGITRTENPGLRDKAGREGLISNTYYRTFVDDLENLFISLARDFFRESSDKTVFQDKKKLLNDQVDALKADRDRITKEKKAFTRGLKEYPELFKKYKQEYSELVRQLEVKISSAKIIYTEIASITEKIKKMDLEYKSLLPPIPKHYKPTELQLERLNSYEQDIIQFTETVKTESSELFKKVNEALEVHELQKEFESNFHLFKNKLEEDVYKYKTILEKKTNEIKLEFKSKSGALKEQLISKKDELKTDIDSKEKVLISIKGLEKEFNLILENFENKIIPAVDHINRISFEIDEELIKGAYRTAYEEMKEQWELTNEMAQLGIAVEIIDHEFNILYSAMNSSIKDITRKIEKNPELIKLFEYFINAFHQLEDKYELLSPLYRAAGIVAKEISGRQMLDYLEKFFQNSFEKEKIKISHTPQFNNYSITIKEPVIYAVLINIINNAIYWLRGSEKKEILFDYLIKTNEILIINSGEKIKDFQLKKIFDLFYSKRGGRGLGLYLAKQSLQKSYMDIYATNDPKYNCLNGACFVINNTKLI